MKRIICYLLIVLMCINPTNAFAATFLNDVFNIYDYIEKSTEIYQNPEQKTTFIVEIEGDPLLTTMQVKDLTGDTKTEKAFFENQKNIMSTVATTIDSEINNEFVYTALFNGFSVTGKFSDFEKIKAIPGVKNVYISREFQVIEPVDKGLQDMLSVYTPDVKEFDGEGILIGVIDAGFEKTHSFFKDEPKNPQLTKEKLTDILTNNNLKSGIKSADDVYVSAKIPYAYNYYNHSKETSMTNGTAHGLHVSGIAAGKNGKLPNGETFSGVAPEAQLLFFGCGDEKGKIFEERVIAAIEDAVFLGVDIINMSFGVDYADVMGGYFGDSILENARKAGISVFAASGNAERGFQRRTPKVQNIDYSASGTPAGNTATMSVASVDGDTYFQGVYKFCTPENIDVSMINGFQSSTFTSLFSSNEYIEYVDCNLGTIADFKNKDLTGKIALVKRGNLNSTEKAENAKNAKAAGIIIYNTQNEFFGSEEDLCLPGATTTLLNGEKLVAAADKRLKRTGTGFEVVSPENAGKPSDFSSWGVDSSLQLNPEISAPGGMIYSSVYENKYGIMSGTSMAAPYMSGIMACVLEYYKTNPFAEGFNNRAGSEKVSLLENIIMNSANITRYKDSNIPYSPRKQGAGRVCMENIIKSKVIIKGDSGKAKLSLGDDISDTLSLNFEITNISNEEVAFDDITVEVLTDGYFTQNNENYVSDSVLIKIVEDNLPESVTIRSGETYNFSATVKLDNNQLAENSKIFTNGFFIDGFVILNTKNNTTKASLPFTGFYGDWGKAPVFDKTIYEEEGSELAVSGEERSTGTLLATYTTNGYIPLGQNPFSSDIFGNKLFFSKKNKNDLLFLSTDFRSTKTICTIGDKSGRILYGNESPTVMQMNFKNKFFMNGFIFDDNQMAKMSDGEYFVYVTARVAGPTTTEHTMKIPFCVDNTAPHIEKVEYNPENKTVTVTASDEKALSAVYVTYTNLQGKQVSALIPLTLEETEKLRITKTFDVSNAESLDSLGIGCVDYALNESNGYYYYYKNDVGMELGDIDKDSDSVGLKVYTKNNTESYIAGRLIAAFYDDKQTLIAVQSVKKVFNAGKEETVRFAFNEDTTKATTLKLFIWGNDNLKTISPPKTIDLSTIK